MRGIRGATQVAENTREAIEEAVVELCEELTRRNHLDPEEITWAIFTVTHDLDADFPARGARVQGWHQVPMICSQEIPVPGSMPRIIRVLLHSVARGAPHHVYLRGAQALRPDLHHGVPFQQPKARGATRAAAAARGTTKARAASKARTPAQTKPPTKTRAPAPPSARPAGRTRRAGK
ncbi:MAG: chorismate mutase [Anaeromyxobacter sp.]|nr:chorismate mutase [Anaeromyxobacter sp.]